jgi:hypothetical protein
MTDTQKKIAAALAAVMHYLKTEEEMAALAAAAPSAQPALPAGPALWGLNGRQSQMQLRNLMQLRAFGRIG